MSPAITRLDEHINAVASCGADPAATLAEVRLLLEVRNRIIALEEAGRELLIIADKVNDVTHGGRPAQSDELADLLLRLDAVVSGTPPLEAQRPASRNEPVEFVARRRERLLRRA